MALPHRLALLFVVSAMALGCLGCSSKGDRPELGRVQGTVTLDGKPLVGVTVGFFPQSGRPATATTDTAGKYDLIYTYGVNGAKLGPHTVSFTWPEGEKGTAPIPPKYGEKSQLKVEVKPGKNTFDFDLKSK